MESKKYWLIAYAWDAPNWTISLVHGADSITLPGSHATHNDAQRQAQMLLSASGVPVVDRSVQ